jgi:hypothetical protein
VSVWETIAVYAGIPGAIVAILSVLTVGTGPRRSQVRYEPGQAWDQPNQLWGGDVPVISIPPADRVGTKRGGAHAAW